METEVAGLLLTGGASRRLGRDKARLVLAGREASQAAQLGAVLSSVCPLSLEVGQSVSGLSAVSDEPRQGPLAAVVRGAAALAERGFEGPVLVLATDLPFASAGLLEAIARHPAEGRAVVPLVAGRLQYLAARWSPELLGEAARLVAAGERRVQAAFCAADTFLAVSPADLGRPDLERELSDFDEPADLERLGLGPLPAEG